MDYKNETALYLQVLNYFNIFFVAVFTLEMLIKMFGFGLVFYFSQLANIFDFFVTIASLRLCLEAH